MKRGIPATLAVTLLSDDGKVLGLANLEARFVDGGCYLDAPAPPIEVTEMGVLEWAHCLWPETGIAFRMPLPRSTVRVGDVVTMKNDGQSILNFTDLS